MAPPPYSLPEHSILKSHLIGRPVHSITDRQPTLKPIHQWTISKKDIIGDCQEEQILFTNDNLQPNVRIDNQELNYGPGMYSAEDIQPDYQYSETAKPGSYQPDYSNYQNNIQTQEMRAVVSQELGVVNTVNQVNTGYINTIQETVNGSYHELPSYDTAIAQQYGATGYVIEDQKTKTSDPPTPVRRSERPVRRRVSPTYDYEDGDLYIDEAPAPARRRRSAPSKHKQYKQTPMPSVTPVTPNNYRHPVSRPAPANGIESLIQASVLAEEPAHSTEDAAVAGMLSISERYSATQQTINQRTFGLASSNTQSESNTTREESNTNSPSKRSRKRTVPSSPEDHIDDEEDVIKEVHRDEEYVYPSLEMSSDEDDDWPPATRRTRSNRHQRNDTKSKSDRDESWSPRARLGRLVPRLRGPARAGVRRECVRAALQAAASTPPTPAAPPHVRHADLQNAKRAVLATKSRRPPPPAHPAPLNKTQQSLTEIRTTFGDEAPYKTTIYNRFVEFKRGRVNL
ncbi:Lysine-specific demethylase phf2 [Eumeta japonica]|uniref:Lysine-specific demethylase phf2 n=1 Tax=Eumeta variegata TaxID=151549 RepID=A0A4C1SU80_EUMVA|nr:Lysine-specific demethylase phf2 [Eumeta japonica]